MRTSRLLLIVSGLALLGVMIFWGVRYKPSAPAVSIRITEVTTKEVRLHVLDRRAHFTDRMRFRLQETNSNQSITPFNWFVDPRPDGDFYTLRFSEPLNAKNGYRVFGPYYYLGVIDEKVFVWGERFPVLYRLILPKPKKGMATSEWFVVKSEGSTTNMEHHAN